MTRLIDADALIHKFCGEYCTCEPKHCLGDKPCYKVILITDAPTIEPSGEQFTSKLKKPCDSLLTDDSEDSKEQKSKLDGDLISRADAIEAVCMDNCGGCRPNECNVLDVCTCVQSLKALPSVSAEPISQTDSLIIADALRYLVKDEERHEMDRTRADALRQQILKHGASLSAEPKRGEWIDMNTATENYYPRYKCSVCGNWANHSNFCPNCGAKMERKEE